eukprot:CCRYP_001629-RA/>CCRYP_001629-RA protein AED:0.20 eAED:0.20 QI:0/-1/0/1/-1/1/1/0/475
MNAASASIQPRTSFRPNGQGLSSQLVFLAAIFFAGWRLLSPAAQQSENNAVIQQQLKGTVTKADRLPSWLRDRAIDKLPLYSSNGNGADGGSDAADDVTSWATHVANNNHPGEQHNHLIFDVILIGSTDQIEQRTSPTNTSASNAHGRYFVRDVFMATEVTVDKTMVLEIGTGARNVSSSSRSCQDTLRSCAKSSVIDEEELCLQRRIGLSIGAFSRRYRKIIKTVSVTVGKEKSKLTAYDYNSSDTVSDWVRFAGRVLPDFLIISFDTLSYNISLLYEECPSTHDTKYPVVMAPATSWYESHGSHFQNSTNHTSTPLTFTHPAVRSGVVFNHAALERFSRPIACYGVNHDPQTEELEYQFCRWTVSKATNTFDSLLHQALVLWQREIQGERSKYISISDLFSAYASSMHLICASHKVIPTGEEVLGYLIYRFQISEHGVRNGKPMSGQSKKFPTILRCGRSTSDDKIEYSDHIN